MSAEIWGGQERRNQVGQKWQDFRGNCQRHHGSVRAIVGLSETLWVCQRRRGSYLPKVCV